MVSFQHIQTTYHLAVRKYLCMIRQEVKTAMCVSREAVFQAEKRKKGSSKVWMRSRAWLEISRRAMYLERNSQDEQGGDEGWMQSG